MFTFKTPEWDSSEICDENYKNLFGKKPKDKGDTNENILKNNKMKKKRTKERRGKVAFNPPFQSDKRKTAEIINNKSTVTEIPSMKKIDQVHWKNKKFANDKITKPGKPTTKESKGGSLNVLNKKTKRSRNTTDLKQQTSGSKRNEYHTLLKSRKEVMKLSLRERMLERLKSSRFRYINEELYTKEGKSAKDLFRSDPKAFMAYHEGYQQQVNKWPMNPLDVIIKSIEKMPTDRVIADMGCGDAKLAQTVQQKVHSFDLQAVNDYVTECEMSNVPLEKNSVDVVVFCLSLMGTNTKDFIFEASRLLKIGGILKIAEVQSRFEEVDIFIKGIEQFGFKQSWKDLSKDLFYFMDFKKIDNCKAKNKLPTLSLLPCLYKKR